CCSGRTAAPPGPPPVDRSSVRAVQPAAPPAAVPAGYPDDGRVAGLLARQRRSKLLERINLIRIGSLAATLGVWEWYGRGVDPIFFSYPTAIVAVVPAMIRSGELQTAFLTSMRAFVIGFALAI